jgi:hypothetical protein
MEACKVVQDIINEAKTDAWRKILEDTTESQESSKMWKIIISLNGTPEINFPNEAISHKERLITSKLKADIFIGHYAGVSSLEMSKEDRIANRLKICLRNASNSNRMLVLNAQNQQDQDQQLRGIINLKILFSPSLV